MNANMSEDLYIVAGATSRTGIIVAKRLLELGRRVRVIGRSVERLDPLPTSCCNQIISKKAPTSQPSRLA